VSGKLGGWVANLSLVAVASMLTLLGFEVSLRVFLPQKLYRYPVGLFRNDPDLDFSLSPGFRGEFRNPEYVTDVRINSLGLRGTETQPKREGVPRVLGLGDSFASAFNVEEGQTFLTVTETILRETLPGAQAEVINAGAPNYGTWHELRMFRRLVPMLQPDAVVLAAYVGNDLENNLDPQDAVVLDGLLLSRTRKPGILPQSLRSWLQIHSMAYVFLWNGWSQVRPWFGQKPVDPLKSEKELVSPARVEKVEKGYRVTAAILSQLRDDAESAGIPLFVVVIPAEFQVYPDRFSRLVRKQGLDPEIFDFDLPQKRWVDMARAANLPVLDLLPIFRSRRAGPYLYMSLDGHLTVEGNRLAGESLAQFLLPYLSPPVGIRNIAN
jgi:hypothetical protein